MIANLTVDNTEEKRKIGEELACLRGALQSVDTKLGNEEFVANADASIVDKEKQKKVDALQKMEALEKRLAQLATMTSRTRSPIDRRRTILMFGTGNAGLSLMAEAVLNHDLGRRVRALSAGISPQPRVDDSAIEALKLAGLPTNGLHPKGMDAVRNEYISMVFTVCDSAEEAYQSARESYTAFLPHIHSTHLSFHDPHGEPLESFIRVLAELRDRLPLIVDGAMGCHFSNYDD